MKDEYTIKTLERNDVIDNEENEEKEDLSENPFLQNALNTFVFNSIYNQYTQELWDIGYLNEISRKDMATQFLDMYLKQNAIDISNEDREVIVNYAAYKIDEMIPKLYFIEYNEDLCKTYSPLLVRRMYDVKGKDDFKETKDLIYEYQHDFKETKKIINTTKATQKQIQYLKKIGKSMGYLLWNEEYLSKNYANQMIEYLTEKVYEEPVVFPFFFISK